MDIDERDRVAQQFGVAPEQVERDHLISYLLAFLSERFGDRIHFIGGTALARTHLPNGRLSEDIDLIAVDSRRTVAEELDDVLPHAVARTHGRLTLQPVFSAVADTLPVTARTVEGVARWGRKTVPDKTTARGYGHKHQQARRRWAAVVRAGRAECARCGSAISPLEPRDLDHYDGIDKRRHVYVGVSHRDCNRARVRSTSKPAGALSFFDTA